MSNGAAMMTDDLMIDDRFDLPVALVRQVEHLYGRFDASAFAAPRFCAARSMRSRDADDVCHRLRGLGLSPRRTAWHDAAFAVPASERDKLLASSPYQAAELYVQNLSSMLPPLALDPQPGEEVLDLAAAPGGKTLHLAQLMADCGRVAAVERVKDRFYRLKTNVERSGFSCIRLYYTDGARVFRKVPERFDRVLLDAPCSADAVIRAGDPASWAHWGARKIEEMSRKQKQLLHSAIQCLKPGGALVYSTCALAPEENELVVQRALDVFGAQIGVEPLTSSPLFQRVKQCVGEFAPNLREGLVEWGRNRLDESMRFAARIVPNDIFEPFFVCRLRKRG